MATVLQYYIYIQETSRPCYLLLIASIVIKIQKLFPFLVFRTFKRISTIFLIIGLLMVPMTSGNTFFSQQKQLSASAFFKIKLQVLRSATLLKKRLCHRCFPVNISKYFKNIFFYRTSLVSASESSYIKTTLNCERILSKMHF